MAKRVFLSFIVEDRDHANGVRLLAKNPNNELEFFDESVQEPFESTNAEYLRRKIKEKIDRTSVTVCLISADTHKSRWVDWELTTSDNKGNAIIAMAVKGVTRAVLPKLIKEKELTFNDWDVNKLSELIKKA